MTNPAAWEQLERERAEEFELAEAARAEGGFAAAWTWGVIGIVVFFIFILLKLTGSSVPLSTPTPEYESFATPSPKAALAPVTPAPPKPSDKLVLMNEVRTVLADSPIHAGPDLSTPIKDWVHAGSHVRILGKQGDFYVVRKLNGVFGFVRQADIGDLP